MYWRYQKLLCKVYFCTTSFLNLTPKKGCQHHSTTLPILLNHLPMKATPRSNSHQQYPPKRFLYYLCFTLAFCPQSISTALLYSIYIYIYQMEFTEHFLQNYLRQKATGHKSTKQTPFKTDTKTFKRQIGSLTVMELCTQAIFAALCRL